jgi:hypothetical protein
MESQMNCRQLTAFMRDFAGSIIEKAAILVDNPVTVRWARQKGRCAQSSFTGCVDVLLPLKRGGDLAMDASCDTRPFSARNWTPKLAILVKGRSLS